MSLLIIVIISFFLSVYKFLRDLPRCGNIHKLLCFFTAWQVKNFVFYHLPPAT